ncbi:MAG: hypothetical protein M3Q97_08445 [Bacteroidota bacterium]|nr:hypothetical protein [Bacteroidota bacterium]
MPHTWNDIMVVTKEELVPAWYSWHNLRVTIDRYKDRKFWLFQKICMRC